MWTMLLSSGVVPKVLLGSVSGIKIYGPAPTRSNIGYVSAVKIYSPPAAVSRVGYVQAIQIYK